ncbi:MAG TPA: hypothetical protein VEF04_06675 [Blastocatellia bacterium]|nr:hypothetical protein [Blastocatellia bacterium]
MSLYDSKDLMEIKSAAREYDVPAITLELAIASGVLRAIDVNGEPKLLRPDVELFVKRTVKRGAGNKVITRLIPTKKSEEVAGKSVSSESSASGNGQ